MDLALIDGIGPFLRGCVGSRINWSKIPFAQLPVSGEEGSEARWGQIEADAGRLLEGVTRMGYNAISFDDVAHLVDHPDFEPEIRARSSFFAEKFRGIFRQALSHGLRVYVTTDYFTATPAVEARLRGKSGACERWFAGMVDRFLGDFPEVSGVILRVGESDGRDVRDPVRSRLALHSAAGANRLLKTLLPVFERRGRTLIFRTWTVGASLLGDMIWHPGRLARTVRGIDSPAFILSMKYGESDFFRFLPLNPQVLRIRLPKLIEFQARREYEGAGEYPSFVGWDCEEIRRELAGAQNVVGLSVWCQTGGWHRFRRLAFLEPGALWIELNAAAILGIVRDGQSVESVVEGFFGAERAPAALELLSRAERVVREILYIPEFAERRLYFRRVRIPPLVHVYWDCLFFHAPVREILRGLVRDPERAIRVGEEAFAHFGRMEELAAGTGLPVGDIRFMRDTFELILLARRYYFTPFTGEMAEQVREAKRVYKARWPREVRPRYRIKVSFDPMPLQKRTLRWLLGVLLRGESGYRTVLDRVLTLNVLSWVYRMFRSRYEEALPKFLRQSAMGVDSILR